MPDLADQAVTTRRPDESEASAVVSWPRDAAETAQWCGSSEHPVSTATMLAWWADDEIEPWVIVDSADRLIGYGELWLDPDEDEVELARIIVAPERRGRGLGRRLVTVLAAKAATTGMATTFLRVVPDNEAAIACYLASGFTPLDAAAAAEWNDGQPREYVWMLAPPSGAA